MRIYKILGILMALIFFAACKDAKVIVTKKSSINTAAPPPGFEVNGEQSTLTFGAITLKGRMESNPVVTSPSSTLTAAGITLRAGVVK